MSDVSFTQQQREELASALQSFVPMSSILSWSSLMPGSC